GQVEAPALAAVVCESGAEQGGAQIWRRADANRLAVEARALSAMGHEAFFLERVEDHAELHAAAPFVRDRHAELRIAVREVGGAVERVDDPSMVALMRAGAAFLGKDRVGRKCAMDHFDDRGFRFAIGFGDQIDRVRLAIDGYSAEALEMNSAGGTRGAQINRQCADWHPSRAFQMRRQNPESRMALYQDPHLDPLPNREREDTRD